MFSGAGGFSEGLKQAGLIDLKWAVEKDKEAAKALEKNNPGTIVFQKDCKELLKEIKRGKKATDYTNLAIPTKGEVDLLCGGPPCQVSFKRRQNLRSTFFRGVQRDEYAQRRREGTKEE